jgi:Ca-activated chloride channel family protein
MRQAEPQQDMSEQAEMQWLRRIPDDPGGLLRNKFRYQYSRQRSTQQEKELW